MPRRTRRSAGGAKILLVVELVDETTVMIFLPGLLRPSRGNGVRGRWTRRKAYGELVTQLPIDIVSCVVQSNYGYSDWQHVLKESRQ